jgi:hypothetical protein
MDLTTAHLADGCLRARVPVRTERRQAAQIRDGVSLRRQVRFDRYLARRQQVPSLTFREHLRDVGGAIEV